jgi:hypothetical protein
MSVKQIAVIAIISSILGYLTGSLGLFILLLCVGVIGTLLYNKALLGSRDTEENTEEVSIETEFDQDFKNE